MKILAASLLVGLIVNTCAQKDDPGYCYRNKRQGEVYKELYFSGCESNSECQQRHNSSNVFCCYGRRNVFQFVFRRLRSTSCFEEVDENRERDNDLCERIPGTDATTQFQSSTVTYHTDETTEFESTTYIDDTDASTQFKSNTKISISETSLERTNRTCRTTKGCKRPYGSSALCCSVESSRDKFCFAKPTEIQVQQRREQDAQDCINYGEQRMLEEDRRTLFKSKYCELSTDCGVEVEGGPYVCCNSNFLTADHRGARWCYSRKEDAQACEKYGREKMRRERQRQNSSVTCDSITDCESKYGSHSICCSDGSDDNKYCFGGETAITYGQLRVGSDKTCENRRMKEGGPASKDCKSNSDCRNGPGGDPESFCCRSYLNVFECV